MKEECEEVWNRLRFFHLLSAVNQSVVEQRLPFGMERRLRPLNQLGDSLKVLKAADFSIDLKDPYTRNISNIRGINNVSSRPLHPKQLDPEPNQRFKFVQHKPISACNSCLIVDDAKMFKFDPSAMLFFKDSGEFAKTNLTSNVNGSVSNDKNQLGSILTQGCWLISLNDLLNNCSSASLLPLVQNNKLRCLKYAEFISQEGPDLVNFGNEVEFVALNAPNTILISRKQGKESKMDLFLVDKNGSVKFSSKTIKRESSESIYQQQVDLENGDLIILIRSKHDLDVRKIITTVLKCSIDQDLEDQLLSCLDKAKLPSALLVSRVYCAKEFDESFNISNALNIKYVSHLDSKVGTIVNQPHPGPLGCTTRHSAIYRENYFVALHHDASKINRFSDTINYIIRKLGNPANLGKRLEQEGEDCVLKRISDVQYFAYVLRLKSGKIVLGLGGGAKCVVISNNLQHVLVHQVPILIELEGIKPSDQLVLISPHFPPSEVIKTIQAINMQEWIKELLKKTDADLQSFKVSLVHFQLLN